MGWNLSLYIESKDRHGKWNLLCTRPLLDCAKDLLEWDDCDGRIHITECSDGLNSYFRRSMDDFNSSNGSGGISDDAWAERREHIMLQTLSPDTLSNRCEELRKNVYSAFNTVFKASGCRFTDSEWEGDFYADKWDNNGKLRKDWNPLTFPINKDIFNDLQQAYFDLQKLSYYTLLCRIVDEMGYTWWSDDNDIVHGETRFIVEYS